MAINSMPHGRINDALLDLINTGDVEQLDKIIDDLAETVHKMIDARNIILELRESANLERKKQTLSPFSG